MKTYGDWFSGFGGMTIGATAAGFKPVFACEYEAGIASVYAQNLGDHVTVADLLTLDSGISHPRFPRTRNGRKRQQQDAQGDWFRRVLARGARHDEFEFTMPRFPHADWKHDSPPCPNFSVAKAGATEGLREIALAVKCCEYLIYARPFFYSLENVYGYRKSESFQLILKTLHALGYGVDYWHLNSADYGVPQTRKRLILVARADGRRPQRPRATHQKTKKGDFVGSLFGDSFYLRPWTGWHEAIADITHSLPDSEFADWQNKRLGNLAENFLGHTQTNSNTDGRNGAQPATTIGASKQPDRAFLLGQGSRSNPQAGSAPTDTVTSNSNQSGLKALLLDSENSGQQWGSGYREAIETAFAISAQKGGAKALLVSSTNSDGLTTRGLEKPAPVVTAGLGNKTPVPKAFLLPGGNANSARPLDATEPHSTVGDANRVGNASRAFLVNGTPMEKRSLCGLLVGDQKNQVDGKERPSFVVDTRDAGKVRCGVDGRVAQMTVRALARFQSFPDCYRFPQILNPKTVQRRIENYTVNGEVPDIRDRFVLEHIFTNRGLSCRGVGNAVPPLLAEAIGKSW